MAQKLEIVTIEKINRENKTPAKGDDYESVGIETTEHGWINGFGDEFTNDWKKGDKVEVEVIEKEYKGKIIKNFRKKYKKNKNILDLDYGEYAIEKVTKLKEGESNHGKWYLYKFKIENENEEYVGFPKEFQIKDLDSLDKVVVKIDNYLGKSTEEIDLKTKQADANLNDLLSSLGEVPEDKVEELRKKELYKVGKKILNFMEG